MKGFKKLMKKKILYLILTTGLLFSLTACQKDASESTLIESEIQQEKETEVKSLSQKEEISQTEEVEIQFSGQTEEIVQSEKAETESINQTEEITQIKEDIIDVIQNEYFSVVFDSVTENENFYIINFVFTNVSDISYYKGDEQYHPGESWEKNCKIVKDKLQDYCKNSNYIHYKLYDLSVYDSNAKELFAGGVKFDLNEELEVFNLETFVDVPIENN